MLLVVDDDRDLRESLRDLLTLQGHAVYCAANGREAIDWFKGRETYPRLIFLDLVMPVLDGWGFLIERRQNPLLSIIPVVVMSGSPGISDRAKAAGAVHVMHKPFGAPELLPVIEQFLGRHNTRYNSDLASTKKSVPLSRPAGLRTSFAPAAASFPRRSRAKLPRFPAARGQRRNR